MTGTKELASNLYQIPIESSQTRVIPLAHRKLRKKTKPCNSEACNKRHVNPNVFKGITILSLVRLRTPFFSLKVQKLD